MFLWLFGLLVLIVDFFLGQYNIFIFINTHLGFLVLLDNKQSSSVSWRHNTFFID